jgi:hypothetical protein
MISYGLLSDFLKSDFLFHVYFSHHWGKADDRNCNYGHPKMAEVESGKNV